MLTLKMIILGLIFIASGGAAFSQLFRNKVWMQVVVGVVGSLSLIFMVREFVRDEMRAVQVSLPVVSAPLVSEPVAPPPQPAVSEDNKGELWYGRGVASFNLGRHEESLASQVGQQSFADFQIGHDFTMSGMDSRRCLNQNFQNFRISRIKAK